MRWPWLFCIGKSIGKRRNRSESCFGVLCSCVIDWVALPHAGPGHYRQYLWYFLFYFLPSGDSIRLFTFEFDFELDFYNHLRWENIFNLLMYLPFGVLYPLFRRKDGWGKTLLAGFLLVVGIELLQPVFGRAFDINDVVLDTLGTSLSATLFFLRRAIFKRTGRRLDAEP